MFMAGGLLLALLNLETDRRAGRSALHLVMAALATFALVVTFQRTTFAVVALLVPLFLLAYRTVGARVARLRAPTCAIRRARCFAHPAGRPAALSNPRPIASPPARPRIRACAGARRAIGAVWAQVREAPVTGVGFGRDVTFTINGVRTTIAQDPHDQYLYLWAGGGLLLLGSFVLLLLLYLRDSWRRFRAGTRKSAVSSSGRSRCGSCSSSTPRLGSCSPNSELLLAFWILMFLPMIVPDRRRGDATIV